MTARNLTVMLMTAAAATWSCSRSPIAPNTTGLGSGAEIQAKGKPGPAPSNDNDYDVTFGGVGSSEEVTSGALALRGSVTGSAAAGNLVATLSDDATIRISGLRELPGVADQCDGFDVLPSGFFGSDLSGHLTVSADQDGTGKWKFPLLDWAMTGVYLDSDGEYRIEGLSTVNFNPTFEDIPGGGFTATLIDSKVFVRRYPAGSRNADLSTGACRVDLKMTVIPAPPQ
jgi:hypothetical protein